MTYGVATATSYDSYEYENKRSITRRHYMHIFTRPYLQTCEWLYLLYREQAPARVNQGKQFDSVSVRLLDRSITPLMDLSSSYNVQVIFSFHVSELN